MVLRELRLRRFRNHEESDLVFGDGINALVGRNGEGKTNVLEGISYLSLTKSFFGAGDAKVLQMGKEAFAAEGIMVGGSGAESTVAVRYDRATGEKTIAINGGCVETFGSVIGMFPVVILSPETGAITLGGPGDRRRFVDILLSQVSRSYFQDLLEFRRVLRQRNKILLDQKLRGGSALGPLEPWNESLARFGSRLVVRRRKFVAEIRSYVRNAYAALVAGGRSEEPEVAYMPGAGGDAGEHETAVAARMAEEIQARQGEEMRRGLTLVGPHRDDLALTLNGVSVHDYASQGQHKTFLVALKVAEFFYLRDRRSEAPLFLLDDMFSELDESRVRHILDLLAGLGQSIVTATDEAAFRDRVEWDERNKRFQVERGKCSAY